MNNFWKEAKGRLHVDAWREINQIENYQITIVKKNNAETASTKEKLFFINLGGYKQNEFEEYHYKYGIDVDDLYEIGYLKLNKLLTW